MALEKASAWRNKCVQKRLIEMKETDVVAPKNAGDEGSQVRLAYDRAVVWGIQTKIEWR